MSGAVLTIEQAAARLGTDPERLARRLAADDRPANRFTRGGPGRHGPTSASTAARADVERRYFRWCAEHGFQPTPEHDATDAEVRAMRARFAAYRSRGVRR